MMRVQRFSRTPMFSVIHKSLEIAELRAVATGFGADNLSQQFCINEGSCLLSPSVFWLALGVEMVQCQEKLLLTVDTDLRTL